MCVQHVAGVLLSESEMEWTCVPARVLGESWPTKHSKANQAQAAVRSTLRNSRTREDLKQQQQASTQWNALVPSPGLPFASYTEFKRPFGCYCKHFVGKRGKECFKRIDVLIFQGMGKIFKLFN